MRPSSSSRAIATSLIALIATISRCRSANAAVGSRSRTPSGFVVVVVIPPPRTAPKTTTMTTATTSTTRRSVEDGSSGAKSDRRRYHRSHAHLRRHRSSRLIASAHHLVAAGYDGDDPSGGVGGFSKAIVEGNGYDGASYDDGPVIGSGMGKKKGTSSSSSTTSPVSEKKRGRKKTKEEDERSHYWHDVGDPFVIVGGDKNLAFGRGVNEVGADGHRSQQQQQQQRLLLLQHDHLRNSSADADGDAIDDRGDRGRKRIKFTIRGNPRVLIRHRTARGFVYNPSRAAQESFRDRVLELLPSRFRPTITDDDDDDDGDDDHDDRIGERGRSQSSSSSKVTPAVLFSEDDCIGLSIIFRMRRPASHFVGSRRTGPGARLKPAYSAGWPPGSIRSDVDNLAKFVMDSLNGVLYVDDRQVVRLSAVKVLDSEGPCLGATEVEICVLSDGDL
ncbi:hypothetical protein ACHAXA_010217 [Cyclostephanos tholiformis]|uniref:Uncharacterized protein n=1 Tax=Cyclostephanos tholiformis TaxID=382380 RepID=A0ABD3SFX6_9STRA